MFHENHQIYSKMISKISDYNIAQLSRCLCYRQHKTSAKHNEKIKMYRYINDIWTTLLSIKTVTQGEAASALALCFIRDAILLACRRLYGGKQMKIKVEKSHKTH